MASLTALQVTHFSPFNEKSLLFVGGLECAGVAVVVAGMSLCDLRCEFYDWHSGTKVNAIDRFH